MEYAAYFYIRRHLAWLEFQSLGMGLGHQSIYTTGNHIELLVAQSNFIICTCRVSAHSLSIQYTHLPIYRHVCSIGAIGNITMMVIGNLIGFCLGVDGMWAVLPKLTTFQGRVQLIALILDIYWATSSGLRTVLASSCCLFAFANVMYESDKRKLRNLYQ